MRIGLAARFTLLLIAVLAGLVGIQVFGLRGQAAADNAADSRVRLAGDVQRIRYYDELLTMSARLAAATGDPSYVQRYQKAVPQLDQVLADALAVVPDDAALQGVRATDQANQALIALETEDFRRLAAGDAAGAYKVVTSSEYERLKADYRTRPGGIGHYRGHRPLPRAPTGFSATLGSR